jgi:hypothetical protein
VERTVLGTHFILPEGARQGIVEWDRPAALAIQLCVLLPLIAAS